jgi:hypothetical protein
MRRKSRGWLLLAGPVLALGFGRPTAASAQVTFADLSAHHWAAPAVRELASQGLLIGYPGWYLGTPARSWVQRIRRRDADLRIMQIFSSELAGANLRRADLHGTGIAFHRVNLTAADFRNADLSGVDLGGATLTRADLTGANLTSANLSFTRARCWPTITATLRYARLTGANLRGADLMSTDLSLTTLDHADLHNADLRDANLTGATLRGADLSGADLTDAILSGAIYDGNTRWPHGFDPQQHGAVPVRQRM